MVLRAIQNVHVPLKPVTNWASSNTTGWTVFTPTIGTTIAYVDPTLGDDHNNGLWPGPPGSIVPGVDGSPIYVPNIAGFGPKRTIAGVRSASPALLHDGHDDWLLLKRGETFFESLAPGVGGGPLQYWTLSGASAAHPMLISCYGDKTLPRPKLATGTAAHNWEDHGIRIRFQPGAVNFLSIVSLEFAPVSRADGNNSPRGINAEGSLTDHLTVEDCMISRYRIAFILSPGNSPYDNGRCTNTTIRRNVMVDSWGRAEAYGGPGTGDGMLIYGADNLLVEENVFDHNGWLDEIIESIRPGGQNYFARNFYCQNLNTGVVIRGNILAGTDGVQVRPGGTCDNNLCLRLGIAISFGAGNGYGLSNPGGVGGTTRGNVIVHGRNFSTDPLDGRGVGIDSGNTNGWDCTWNLIAHNHIDVDGARGRGINIGKVDVGVSSVGCVNSNIAHNIVYDWEVGYAGSGSGAYVQCEGNPQHILGSTLTDNDFQCTSPGSGGSIQHMVEFVSSDTITGNFVNARNRWFMTGKTSTDTIWLEMGAGKTLAQWMTDTGDSTSTYGAVTYTDPTRDVGLYHLAHAADCIHGIVPDGTLATYLRDVRLQNKQSWDAKLMPASMGGGNVLAGGTYPARGCSDNSFTAVQAITRWIRDGFDMTMGVSVTDVSVTGSPGTHTGPAAGGTPITVTGTGFNLGPDATTVHVFFGGTGVAGVVTSPTTVTCVTPAHAAGDVDVWVDNHDGHAKQTNGFHYT